jgi:hypothetical protein
VRRTANGTIEIQAMASTWNRLKKDNQKLRRRDRFHGKITVHLYKQREMQGYARKGMKEPEHQS